jgi:hypothetical protein
METPIMMKRRTALGLLAGAAGAAALTPDARAAGAPALGKHAFDPSNPAHVALAFRKLSWSMDESLTFQWLHGTRYGIQGSLLTPFWEMHVATWFRTRDLGEGRYDVRSAGSNFYTLPGETKLLEQFHNPYTAQTVDIPYMAPRATKAVYDQNGGTIFGDLPGMKTTRNAALGPAWVQGEELSVRSDLQMHGEPLEAGKRSFTVQDMSTWIGRIADVMDPKVRNPPARHMFNDVLDFPPYLKMGDQPGTYFSRCHGGKVHRYQDMPATWRALFEQKFPDIARDPGALLEKV